MIVQEEEKCTKLLSNPATETITSNQMWESSICTSFESRTTNITTTNQGRRVEYDDDDNSDDIIYNRIIIPQDQENHIVTNCNNNTLVKSSLVARVSLESPLSKDMSTPRKESMDRRNKENDDLTIDPRLFQQPTSPSSTGLVTPTTISTVKEYRDSKPTDISPSPPEVGSNELSRPDSTCTTEETSTTGTTHTERRISDNISSVIPPQPSKENFKDGPRQEEEEEEQGVSDDKTSTIPVSPDKADSSPTDKIPKTPINNNKKVVEKGRFDNQVGRRGSAKKRKLEDAGRLVLGPAEVLTVQELSSSQQEASKIPLTKEEEQEQPPIGSGLTVNEKEIYLLQKTEELEAALKFCIVERDEATKLVDSMVCEKKRSEDELEELRKKFEEVQEERIRSAFEIAKATETNGQLLKETTEDKERLKQLTGGFVSITANMHEIELEKDAVIRIVKDLEYRLELAHQENQDYVTKLSLLESERDNLYTSKEELKRQVSEANDQIKELKEASSTTNSDDSTVDSEKVLLLSKVSEFEEANKTLQEQHMFALEETRRHHIEKGLIEAELEEIKTQKNEIERQLFTFEEESITWNLDKVLLEDRLAELEFAKNSIESELKDAKNEIEKLQADKELLEEDAQHVTNDFKQELDRVDTAVATLGPEKAMWLLQLSELEEANHKLLQQHSSALEDAETHRAARASLSAELEDLKSIKDDHEDRLLQFQEESFTLEADKASLEVGLAILESAKTTVEDDLGYARQQIERLQADKENLASASAESQSKLQALIQTLEMESATLNSEKVNALSQLSELETAKQELEVKCSNALEHAENRRVENESLSAKLEDLSATKNDLDRQISDLQDESNAWKEEKSLLEKNLEEMKLTKTIAEGDLDFVKNQIKLLQADKDALQTELDEKTENSQHQFESVKAEVEMLRSEQTMFETQISELATAKETLQGQHRKAMEDAEAYRASMESLSTELDGIKATKNKLESKLEKMDEEALTWGTDKKALEDQLKELEGDKNAIKDQLDVANKQGASMELLSTELDELKTAKTKLEGQVEQMNEEAVTWGSDRKAFEDQLNELKDEKNAIENQLNVANQQRKALEDQLKKLEGEKNTAEEQLEDANENVNRLKAEKEILTAESEETSINFQLQLEKLKGAAIGLISKKEELAQKVSQLEDANLELEAQNSYASEDAEALRAENDCLMAQVEDLTESTRELELHLSMSKDESDSNSSNSEGLEPSLSVLECATKSAINVQLIDDIREEMKKLQEENVQLDDLKEEVKQLQAQNNCVVAKTEEETARIESVAKSAINIQEIEDLKEEVKKLQAENDKLNGLKEEVKKVRFTVTKTEEESTWYRKQLKKKDSEAYSLASDRSTLQAKVSKLERAHHKLQDEHTHVLSVAKRLRSENRKLSAEIDCLKATKNEMKDRLADIEEVFF